MTEGWRRWITGAALPPVCFGLIVSSTPSQPDARLWPSAEIRVAITSGDIGVIDGDTVRVRPYGSIRLIGFNAPESRRNKARCTAEMTAGRMAKARLKELLRSGTVSLSLMPCSCAPRTVGTPRCNFGRACGRLTVDDRNVGEMLIGEALAMPYVCGATRCPRRPSAQWCG